MKIRRISAAAAPVAIGALVLGACSGPETGSAIEEDTSVSVGWNQPFYSQNNLTSVGNATTNANVLYLTNAQFNYYDGDLNLVKNEDVGTYEKVSDDPLTIKYTLSEGVKWSDGTAVDAADLILWWGPQDDDFDNVQPEYDEEGNVSNQEAIDAGVYFDGSSVAMTLINDAPTIGDDGRSVEFVYSEPRSDWEVSVQPSPVAAHAVANLALGIEDAEEGKQAIIDAFTENKTEDLSKIAKVWNSGFDFTSLPDDPQLYLSSGAYVMSDYVENQYMTLTARDDYEWGPKPNVSSVTIRYTEDPLASVTALQNGEVDLIQPQSSVDVIKTLEGLDGIEYTTAPEGTFEHVDTIMNNGGPFDPATYGGDAEKARKVREAFLKTVPRQEIIEKLIKPLQEDAETRDSFTVVPGSPTYDDVIANNGSEAYAEVDIEGAKALLAEAGVATPVNVRFLYGKSNVRRANEYQLIAASAAQAGFTVIDEGDDQWGQRLTDTASYDASLFGWQSTNTFALNSEGNYVTGGLNNFGGYSNADVDAWYEEMATAEGDEEKELTTNIEKQLYADAFGVPIFQFPGVVANRDVLQGVSTIPLSPTIFWNYWEWEISAEDSLDAPSATPAATEETEG
ncbi:ABC transporter family substrate-binding protein [Cellulomonas fimi]|uniref:Extracellular solute-binding protein family 5 n=1 Tax=Cellulomonas fimi (strain ATCC 484 / DSM 20113 / JCM 1341 / CCUG 24087 / LMG 16345 / NBRC 15513 / NCIMB 8980 / NCTC 7547 / NRS-133) TaxID=590998 RepID=F4H8M0_CELFA|nr:ABC transporter family substrate-binding protein [Cellulomonas fimi]AEE47028.1 extracellular solute-binding protein family 5 [Cellulomonas fimi ATCC 484]NNH07771.1 ABC transporter family substrate-binding protein [Cellulomonas fimi]VEH34897.1 Periplasmic oligopeptide-binding protein precursor [Cellulomonas fimi]